MTGHPDDRGERARGRHIVEPVTPTGHRRWCEPGQCHPLDESNPFSGILHTGAGVMFGDHDGGELTAQLTAVGDGPATVRVSPAILNPDEARRLARCLDRLADLAGAS